MDVVMRFETKRDRLDDVVYVVESTLARKPEGLEWGKGLRRVASDGFEVIHEIEHGRQAGLQIIVDVDYMGPRLARVTIGYDKDHPGILMRHIGPAMNQFTYIKLDLADAGFIPFDD